MEDNRSVATDNQRLREVYAELTQMAASAKFVRSQGETIRAADGFEIVVPDSNLSPFDEFDPISIEGEPLSEMLVRDRR